MAILPAATDELHLIGDVPEFYFGRTGDKAAGIREIIAKTESGLRVTTQSYIVSREFLKLFQKL